MIFFKKRFIPILLCLVLMVAVLGGCSFEKDIDLEHPYDVYNTSSEYGLTNESVAEAIKPFAQNLCVIGFDNTDNVSQISSDKSAASAVFNTSSNEVNYANNIYERLNPASTTKILTAYLAIKYGDLDKEVTVTSTALDGLDPGSSVCGVAVGDKLTLRELLYGLLLCSGNDAACVIAESVSGSIDDFVKLMNKEAKKLGCTGSHFANPHGITADDHYTTVYDLYLIFNAAIQYDDFTDIISTKSYEADYTNESGEKSTYQWSNTNWYLTGDAEAPDNITVIGGKTGTTDAAGSCLVLLSNNKDSDNIISIVLKASDHEDLYSLMTEMLSNFSD